MSDDWRTNVRVGLVGGNETPAPVVFVDSRNVDRPDDLLWEDSIYAALVTDQIDTKTADEAVAEWRGDSYAAVFARSVYRLDDVIDLGPWESNDQACELALQYRQRKATRRQAGQKAAATRKQRAAEAQRVQNRERAEAQQSREQQALAEHPRIVEAVKALTRHLGDPRANSSCHLCHHPFSFHNSGKGLCKAIGCSAGPNGSVCNGFVATSRAYRIAPFVDEDKDVGLQVFTTDSETSDKIAEVILAGLAALSEKASA